MPTKKQSPVSMGPLKKKLPERAEATKKLLKDIEEENERRNRKSAYGK